MSPLPNDDMPFEEWDEESRRLFESGSLADFLGIKVEYEPDADSPPIDYDALLEFVRRESDDASAREVCRLVARYRPWHDSLRDVLRPEARPN